MLRPCFALGDLPDAMPVRFTQPIRVWVHVSPFLILLLQGGRHDSRAGAEGRSGFGGVALLCRGLPLLAMKLEEAMRMMLSVYATLGVFLLLASRNPSAHRSLIAFAA